MKHQVKAVFTTVILTSTFFAAAFLPAIHTAAEEASPINAYAKMMLEDHVVELKEQKRAELVREKEIADIKAMEAEMNELVSASREEEVEENTPHMRPIGTYQLTAYIATGNRCASGVWPTCNHTVACNTIPMGTRIYIEGYGEYVVEDTGGMGGGVIDIFVSDYGTAIQFGRRTAEIYIIEE